MASQHRKSWQIIVRGGDHRFFQVRISRWLVNLSLFFVASIACSAIGLGVFSYTQIKTINALNSDLLQAGKSIDTVENFIQSNHVEIPNKESFQEALKTLTDLRERNLVPSSNIEGSRFALKNDIQQLEGQLVTIQKEKKRLETLVTIMTSEISGNRNSRRELEEERAILLTRITNLEQNLEYQIDKSQDLQASLQTVLDRISGVVGLPVLLDSDAVLTANALARRLKALFVTHTEILHRLTTETNKATLQARSVIEKAGFDPEEIIDFPLDKEASPELDQSQGKPLEYLGNASEKPYLNYLEGPERVENGHLDNLLSGIDNSEPFSGQGGPLITTEVPDANSPVGNVFAGHLYQLVSAVEHYDAMNDFVDCLPLESPLNGGRLTSGYGYRRDPFIKRKIAFHGGLDIANKRGTEILATGPGRVTYAAWAGLLGRTVTVDHGCGFSTRYGHLQKIFVKPGEQLKMGQVIASMGSTGRSTGPHLHYEITYQGRHLNPLTILRVNNDLW